MISYDRKMGVDFLPRETGRLLNSFDLFDFYASDWFETFGAFSWHFWAVSALLNKANDHSIRLKQFEVIQSMKLPVRRDRKSDNWIFVSFYVDD